MIPKIPHCQQTHRKKSYTIIFKGTDQLQPGFITIPSSFID